MASTETLQVKIIADASSLSKELSNVSTQLRNTEDSLEGLTNVGKGMQQVGKVVTAVGVAITGAIGAIVMKGSEWQESVNTTNFLYGNLDKSIQKNIEANTANARSIGLTEQQYRASQTSMSTFFKNMGFTTDQTIKFSNETTTLAANLAAACNVPYDQALEDIRSATLGNYEALDKYNLNLSANQLSQSEYAKSLGKTWNQMSDNEKMQCVLNEMLRQGGIYSGFAEQEAGGFASQLRMLKEDVSELAGTLGATLLPALEPFIQKVGEVVQKIKEWVEEHPQLAQAIMIVIGAIGLLMAILGPIIMLVGTILANLTILSALFSGALAPAIIAGVAAFGQFIAIAAIVGLAIAAIIQIGQYLIENWDQIKANAIEVWNNICSVISAVAQAIWNVVTTAWNGLKSDTIAAWNAIKSLASTVWNGIKTVISTVCQAVANVAKAAWNGLKSDTQAAWNTIKSVTSSVWNGIKSLITTVVNGVKSAVTTAWNGIKSTTTSAFNSVKSTASSIWNGIKSTMVNAIDGAKNRIRSAMSAIKSAVNVFLKPRLSLPHISVSGRLSLNPPSVPKISVAWYSKGAIFKRPTVFGGMGVGDRHNGIGSGAEAILPIDKLPEILGLDKMVGNNLAVNIENFNNNREQDINQLAEEIAFYLKRKRF